MYRKTAWTLLLLVSSTAAQAQDAVPSDSQRVPDEAAATAGPRGERVPSPAYGAAESGVVIRQSSEGNTDIEFKRLDTNGDGVLSREELAADEREDRGYVAVDRDENGYISRGEFSAFESMVPPSEPSD